MKRCRRHLQPCKHKCVALLGQWWENLSWKQFMNGLPLQFRNECPYRVSHSSVHPHLSLPPPWGSQSGPSRRQEKAVRGPWSLDHRATCLPCVCLFISSFLTVDQDVIHWCLKVLELRRKETVLIFFIIWALLEILWHSSFDKTLILIFSIFSAWSSWILIMCET